MLIQCQELHHCLDSIAKGEKINIVFKLHDILGSLTVCDQVLLSSPENGWSSIPLKPQHCRNCVIGAVIVEQGGNKRLCKL